MLRRFNAALYEAPSGARIQIVVDSQDNNGVKDARFQYGTDILDRETILGLPGCTFTVGPTREQFQAGVVFDPAAPGSARYDMFEVENGVASPLSKNVKNSASAPLLAFAVDPVASVAAAAPVGMARPAGARAAAPTTTKKKTAARKKSAAKKKTAKKKTAPAKKKTARTKTTARKAVKKTAPKKRKTSRKRPK